MNILALDLSLTSTGYALPDGTPGTLKPRIRPDGRFIDLTGPARLSWIRDEILGLEHDNQADLVAIEGYSFNSRASQAHSLGELGGVVRCALHDADIPWIALAPTTVKKYATGSGSADKLDVILAARDRLGYRGKSNDEADALWIRAAVADAAGHPVATVPATHRNAITDKTLVKVGGKKKRIGPSVTAQVATLLEVADAA